MNKKLILILLISIIITSCGKKGCPKFSDAENEKCDSMFID
tara:strand:- start:56 stop:178 length:123 start_codon:yes stop_codon:yes gene_type:complete